MSSGSFQVDAAACVEEALKGRGRLRSFITGASRGRRRHGRGKREKDPRALFIEESIKGRLENRGA